VCGDLWERALVPLQQVLADTGITLSQLHAVELIGGATRVPKLQAVLGAYVGKQGLDRHLDADEAVSLGAALQAANLSDGFKLNRKIGMVDGSTYGIVIKMDGATLESEDQKLLVPRMKKLPSKVSTPGLPNALEQSWQV
jgi:hypoxia up-regulated 1